MFSKMAENKNKITAKEQLHPHTHVGETKTKPTIASADGSRPTTKREKKAENINRPEGSFTESMASLVCSFILFKWV